MAELDEKWSYVRNKANQRWLCMPLLLFVPAYVFGKRKDRVFRQLQVLLEHFGISRSDSDDWGAYERNIDLEKHEAGKRNTQKVERRNLNFRTWTKRLARKSICFSKIERMHDIVIGLLINVLEFGVDINAKPHI